MSLMQSITSHSTATKLSTTVEEGGEKKLLTKNFAEHNCNRLTYIHIMYDYITPESLDLQGHLPILEPFN